MRKELRPGQNLGFQLFRELLQKVKEDTALYPEDQQLDHFSDALVTAFQALSVEVASLISSEMTIAACLDAFRMLNEEKRRNSN